MQDRELFKLDNSFIAKFAKREPHWGPVGKITYVRTYARSFDSTPKRIVDLGKQYGLTDREEFWLTCVRVVEGTFRIQQDHCLRHGLPWSNKKAQTSAQDMYQRMFAFKWLPAGRGMWMMGTDFVEKKGGACLNSCAFVSTKDIDKDFSAPFCFAMDMSMLGVGMGFDTRGISCVVKLVQPQYGVTYVVEDTREGWVDLIKKILNAYVGKDFYPRDVDYSKIRKKGEPIRGFGGTSSGYEPLRDLVNDITNLLQSYVDNDKIIDDAAIDDIMCMIGRCVVAGNIRRSALIALGEPNGQFELLKADLPENKEALSGWRWAANHSIFAYAGQKYDKFAAQTAINGETGYLWLDNAQQFGRMKDPPTGADERALGANPCNEQTLENFELCCLVETFPGNCEDSTDFDLTLKVAYMYGKTVTLVPTHDVRTNNVIGRNRRIGTSMSGIVQAIKKFGRERFMQWADIGYCYLRHLDEVYSNWLCVPRSIKVSSVKPSGTISLLPGVTPGMHWDHAEYYFRVIRFETNSPLVVELRNAGYQCVEVEDEPNTTAVYFAVHSDNFDRAKSDVSMWEQLHLAADLQYYWADNQVSCTVTFQEHEAKDIARALECFDTKIKGISFLPLRDHGYIHAPYQTITKEQYDDYSCKLRPLKLHQRIKNEKQDRFCESDRCMLA